MKVLLFAPTYELSKGVIATHKRTLDSINGLMVPDDVDLTVKISNNNPYQRTGEGRNDHENTLHQYQLGRALALNEGYDAMLTVESDMIIPKDALFKLTNQDGLIPDDAGVVYGLYRFRRSGGILSAARAVRAQWADMSVSFFPELMTKGFKHGWIDVSGFGFGCTLIKRWVLEKVEMRRAENGGYPAPDTQFATDCVRQNIRQVCRFDVPCGHITSDGSVLWPTQEEGKAVKNVKIFINSDFIASIYGKSVPYKAGEEGEMPADLVNEYARAGYVSIVKTKPAVKVVAKPKTTAKKTVKTEKEVDAKEA